MQDYRQMLVDSHGLLSQEYLDDKPKLPNRATVSAGFQRGLTRSLLRNVAKEFNQFWENRQPGLNTQSTLKMRLLSAVLKRKAISTRLPSELSNAQALNAELKEKGLKIDTFDLSVCFRLVLQGSESVSVIACRQAFAESPKNQLYRFQLILDKGAAFSMIFRIFLLRPRGSRLGEDENKHWNPNQDYGDKIPGLIFRGFQYFVSINFFEFIYTADGFLASLSDFHDAALVDQCLEASSSRANELLYRILNRELMKNGTGISQAERDALSIEFLPKKSNRFEAVFRVGSQKRALKRIVRVKFDNEKNLVQLTD